MSSIARPQPSPDALRARSSGPWAAPFWSSLLDGALPSSLLSEPPFFPGLSEVDGAGAPLSGADVPRGEEPGAAQAPRSERARAGTRRQTEGGTKFLSD